MGWSSPAPALSTCSKDRDTDYDTFSEKHKVQNGNVVFTYSVEFKYSEVHWASRWDVYLTMNDAVPEKVHWFSIVNSVLIVVFLAFMVAMILIRTLNRDITKYNRVMTDEEKAEEREARLEASSR